MANELTAPPSAFPERVTGGDTIKADFAGLAADYPAASGNGVTATFTPASGGTPVSVAATGGSDAWSVVVPAATTANWAPGVYRWSLRVTNGSDKLTVDQGELLVVADPASAATDTRSHARKVLDAVEAALESRASRTDLETEFADGRRIRQLSHQELIDMRTHYARLVKAEERKARGAGPGRVLARL